MRTQLSRVLRLSLPVGVFCLVAATARAQGQFPGNPVCSSVFPDIPYYPGLSSCSAVPPIPAGSTQCLDVRIPAGVAPHSPTLLFLHGGGWGGGSKAANAQFLESLCLLGYRVVSANYTLSYANAPSFPQAVIDVRAAVGWIKTQGAAYGLSDCIVAVGTSAGGHLAAMIGALAGDSTHLAPAAYSGVDLSVRLVITFSGDFDPYRRGCETTSCPCPLCYPTGNDIHLKGLTNDFNGMTEQFVGYQWGVAVPSQYTPFPCPVGAWNYQALSPGALTKDPFLNASPVHWLNPTSSPIYMFHSNCDGLFPVDEPDWMIAAAAAYGIQAIKDVGGCGHSLNIYGEAGSAGKVDDVIRNSVLAVSCP